VKNNPRVAKEPGTVTTAKFAEKVGLDRGTVTDLCCRGLAGAKKVDLPTAGGVKRGWQIPKWCLDEAMLLKRKRGNIGRGFTDELLARCAELATPEQEKRGMPGTKLRAAERPAQTNRRGRPVGSVSEDREKRKKNMLDGWDRGEYETKAGAARANGFDRSQATLIINAHMQQKCRD
jgi:hypothetical protein